ncbi:hypothetical protein OC713_02625 [Sweet potato little leaf phytoplasma]|nr:hypothetical protein [Sweet potato little leaf phytoplasma]MDO7987399.1 hypothetical protein [Sweet potato little leaf phytoplasma]
MKWGFSARNLWGASSPRKIIPHLILFVSIESNNSFDKFLNS